MTEHVLLSLRAGRPRLLVDAAGSWTTAFLKAPVEGPARLGPDGLEGDGQADLEVHGGPDKAVCVYAARHLASWRDELGLELGPGAFGENFTVDGQDEESVSIGDVFSVGGALVEVSQPRGPCWKLARRWDRPDLPKRVAATRRTGWYLRVLREGLVAAEDALRLVERRAPEWTIARVVTLTYFADPAASSREMAALASCERLARSWRLSVARRAAAAIQARA